ncbi:YncE family protein [Profundibacterium mesophilum]|uniref:YncE family protein n=1 Tax=Profundibacterium mesophilum TaxID=1258573 RepID=UPI001F3C46D3|nr:YncE family protein [Profundibacterium mesophilum]
MARPSNLPAFLWLALTLAASQGVAGDFAYVTNQGSEDLSIIDLDARKETARIPVPGKPAGVAASLDGIFTVSPEDKTVRRFGPDGAQLGAIRLDGGPIGIVHDPARGRLYVSDWYNARIWEIDARRMRLTGTLESGSAPAGLDISHSGRWLASADRDSNAVSLFDIGGSAPRRSIPVGSRPFGLAFDPRDRLFVANVGSDDVSVIDPRDGTQLALVPVGARPYGIAFAQGRAFVTNQYAGTLSVIDLETLEVSHTLEVGEYPEGVAVAGSDGPLVVANWFSNTVTLIDPRTLETLGEVETGDGPRAFGRFIIAP